MTVEELAARMIELQYKHDQKMKAVEKIGFDCSFFDLEPDLYDLALDALGVPEDNTVQLIKIHGDQKGMEHPDLFCRDWFYEIVDSTMRDGGSEAAMKVVALVKKECKKNGL